MLREARESSEASFLTFFCQRQVLLCVLEVNQPILDKNARWLLCCSYFKLNIRSQLDFNGGKRSNNKCE